MDDNLTSLADVRAVLTRLKIRPNRGLGQNFLVERGVLDVITRAADLQPDDQVLEIGAGLGVLTEQLIATTQRVWAVELDKRLYDHLVDRFDGNDNLHLQQEDALKLDMDAVLESGINKVVANLPYSVGSRIVVDLVLSPKAPERIVTLLQHEVAQRLTASVGNKDYNAISIWSQYRYDVSIAHVVSPNCFWPRPEVTSAIVRFVKLSKPRAECKDEGLLFELTKYAFQYRRKQLATTLRGAPGRLQRDTDTTRAILDSMNLDSRIRPERLSVEQWCDLCNRLKK